MTPPIPPGRDEDVLLTELAELQVRIAALGKTGADSEVVDLIRTELDAAAVDLRRIADARRLRTSVDPHA